MTPILIFDVDGTLTGPRRRMHEDFARFFKSVCLNYQVYLVSGSDMPKLEQQLPECARQYVTGFFPCSANELIVDDQHVYRMEHVFSEELNRFLQGFIENSKYPIRTGAHLEARTGTLNVSIVGREADHAQRQAYFSWDNEHGEREKLIAQIVSKFPEYEANVGGQISVDITPRGWNKSRVQRELNERFPGVPLVFFGDNMHVGGNDRPLGDAIKNASLSNKVYAVEDHYDTWRILQDHYSQKLSAVSVA